MARKLVKGMVGMKLLILRKKEEMVMIDFQELGGLHMCAISQRAWTLGNYFNFK